MSLEPNTTKRCLECLNSIDASAVKCSHCGTYQNWRRYLSFGQSTLALILSVIALSAVVIPDRRSALKEIGDFLSGTNFALGAALVDIKTDSASVLVVNNQDSAAALNVMQCVLNLPLEPYARAWERSELRKAGNADGTERPLTESETMGIFLITFERPAPVFVRKYESAVITLPVAHISPPLRSARERKPEDAVTNACIVSGTNLEDNFAGGAIIVKPSQIDGVDLLEILERADYGKQRESERKRDISLVQKARTATNNE